MEIAGQNFGRDELAGMRLRQLFEARGFKRVRVNKFEEYALYVENKNFLDTESIITFMDLDGKLMAVKPDVTLSVVKNIPRQKSAAAQKLYYVDEVCRLSRENREYKIRNQIGVELIGPPDDLASLEIVELALESLGLIGESSLLDIAHLGFLSGLLEELGLGHREEREALSCLHTKNISNLAQVLEQAGTPEAMANRMLALAGLHGAFHQELAKAGELICNRSMEAAFRELSLVAEVLRPGEDGQEVNLDFSVVNDLDYYNGLIFRGYVQGIPKLVLTGGRYDNMMRKMKKQSDAIGFAISLDELGTYLKSGRRYDFDLLVTYPEGCDYGALLRCRAALCRQGKRVRLEREDSDLDTFTYRAKTRFTDEGLEEEESC